MQNFGVTKKEHYGMLWYFLEWSIGLLVRNIPFKDYKLSTHRAVLD